MLLYQHLFIFVHKLGVRPFQQCFVDYGVSPCTIYLKKSITSVLD